MQKCQDPSGLQTRSTGVKNGDVLERMMPYASMTTTWRSSSSFCSWG
jgi:hypothetical protein